MALAGDYGKPRPAVVVQGEVGQHLPTVVVCPLTTTIRPDLPDFRIEIVPTANNGLRQPSQVMVDKPSLVPRTKLAAKVGRLTESEMSQIGIALAVLLDLS